MASEEDTNESVLIQAREDEIKGLTSTDYTRPANEFHVKETSTVEAVIGPDYGVLGGESLTRAVKGNDAPLGSGVFLKVPCLEKVVCEDIGKESEDVLYNEIQDQVEEVYPAKCEHQQKTKGIQGAEEKNEQIIAGLEVEENGGEGAGKQEMVLNQGVEAIPVEHVAFGKNEGQTINGTQKAREEGYVIDETAELAASRIDLLEDESQEVNSTTVDPALETNICSKEKAVESSHESLRSLQEESRATNTQVGDSKVHPYGTVPEEDYDEVISRSEKEESKEDEMEKRQEDEMEEIASPNRHSSIAAQEEESQVPLQSEIGGEIKEDGIQWQVNDVEEIPVGSQGDFNLEPERTILEEDGIEREESDHSSFVKKCQNKPESTETGNIEEMIPNSQKTCLENTIVDQTETTSQGVETESESIEKVESIVLNKEEDDFENVMATQIEHVIPEKLDNEEAAFMLGETSHPTSEVALQNKLESSETIEDKIQIDKEDEFVNAEESCIEHLDNQGEPTSGPETVIDTVAEKDTGNTLLVENSEVVDIKDETDEQPGVSEQQAEESISGTEAEAEAVRYYDKPFDKVSECIEGAATDEQVDLIKQGQPVIAVKETPEEQREGSNTTEVDEGETDCTEEERLLTTETGENWLNERETEATNNKDFKKLQGNLNEAAAPTGVNFTSTIPEAAGLPNINATEQENTSETKMSEESIESEVGNITLSTQYDNIEGKEMQTAVNGTGTSVTKELNANTGEDVKQANNFTGEKDEYHDTESTIHEADQENASVDKNFDMSIVKDEAIYIGDNENPAVEKYPKNENINEKSSNNKENLISEDEKEENKMQMEDVQQESLAEDLISQCDNTAEKKVQIDTSDEFNENDRFKDTLPDSLTEKVTEGYQDNEKEAKKLPQEVVDKTNENLSISSSNAKHETSGEEDEATESASNENTAEPPNYHIMMDKVSSMSGNITSRDDSNEEDNLQVKDAPEAPVGENTISRYSNIEKNVAQEDAIEEFIEDDQIKGTSPECPLGKMAEDDPDDATEANELTGKNLSAVSMEVEKVSNCSSIVKDKMSTEAENENLSRLEDEKNDDGETNSLTTMEEVSNVLENITSQDGKIGENIQMEDVPQESEVENIIYQSENTAETDTKHTSEEFKEETGTSPASSAKEYSDNKQAKELSKENFQNPSTVSKEVETEHSDLSTDTSTEKYETTAEGENENLAVEEHADEENVVGGHYQDDDTEVTTIQPQDVSPEPFEDYIVSQIDQVKSTLPGSLTENLDEGYQDDGMEAEEVVDTETEDLSLSSSTVKHITSGEGEYLDLSRVEDVANDSGENDNTAVEPPKLENIMEEASTISGNITYLDNNEENMMQAKDSRYSNMEEKFVQDTTEVFTEDGQVKGTSPEPPQEKMIESDTDDGKETSELPEKKLESHSALRKEVDTEHEDLSYSSSIVKDETNAEAENENLSGLEGEISENGDNTSSTAIEEVSTISENIIGCDDKREEEKIQMEDVSQESLAEKIISRPENTAEKVTQIEHTSHESIAELGASPDSPAEEISEGYSDHREAKQLPKEISENLSIFSKEIKTGHLDQSIYPSIDENETTAAGENEKLAVEEHTDDENIVGAKSATFQDDDTELKITQLEDASPEPMEENFVTQTNTEDDHETEETSIQFTEDEYVKGSSVESSVAEGHIEEDEEKKQFPEEKYENRCKESKEEGKEHEDLIHDTSKCETSPGGDEQSLKVQEHPKDEKSTKASTMAENKVVQGEIADEEKTETEHISKKIAEHGHVKGTSAETSFEKIVESNIDDVKDIEEFPEEMSANGDDEHLTSEASPEEGKIIEEASPVALNIISQDNENEEKEMQMEGTNAQSPGESNLVDTAPEYLAEGKAESSTDDVHEAMEGTSEQYKEESNLEETPSEPLAEKEAEISTNDGQKGNGFTEELTTMGGESFAVEHSAVEGEHEDLDHDSSTLDHAIITMEDNEEVIVEKKLKKDDNITGEAPISAGNTIHQEDDSIDAVKMQQEDGPETRMEGSATPLDDNTEGQNADEKSTEASSKAGNKVSRDEIADEEKAESEHISKIFTEDDPETGTSTEISFEKIVDSNIDDVEVIEEFLEEMSANEDDEHLTSETSPEDGKIIEEASPAAVNIISQDNENEEKEMQMESTNAQGPAESNRVDTPLETLAEGKSESSTDDVHEAMEGTREQYKEESNLEDTPSEPLAEKEPLAGKGFTEELTTGGASFSVEHAAVDREHEDLDHDLSISYHAINTMEDNEEVIVEEKLKSDDNITGEAPFSAGNTIHQEDDSIDAVNIQQEDGRETSMEGSATPLDVKTSGQNAQIQDSNEELTKDEDEAGLLPGYPSEDVLQTSTNKEKECSNEQKCENLLTESTENEKDREDAVHGSASPIDGTAKEYVKLKEDETVTNEITIDGASSSIAAEVVHNDTALNKAEEFLPITLSLDDKGTDQKALTEDKIEQATDTVKEINELADLDKFENDNDQLQKEEAPEASEEIMEEYNMETDQEELTTECHTGTSPESPDENIVNINGDDGKRKNELNEENTENHSVEHTAIGEGHKDLGLQTSYLENVTSKGENNEFEKEETPEKEKIIVAKSLSAAKNSIHRDYNNEEKMEIEDATCESVEGSTVSEDYNTEEKDTQKDDISQPIEGNHATVTSAEAPIEVGRETNATDGNKAKENITEECESPTAGSTQEYNEMLTTQKDTKEETVQVSSAIIGETMADNISLNNNEQFLSTDSSNEGERTEQTSMKDMAEDKTDTKNQMEEQNDQIQREVKEQPAEIMEQEKIEEEAVLNDDKVIEGVGKEDLKSPAEEYEESASRESAEGILIATTSQLEEPTISLSTEEDIFDSEKKICQELTDFPDDKLKFCADDDAKEDMATEEGSLRNSSVHNREDAFDLSGQEEGNEKQQTDEATCERSESINIETQETGSIEETELFTINDQQRETDNSEVSEENFGKANADERITGQCKELDSFHNLEASERETVSEKTTEHVEASSLAATGHAADDDFITEDHEESFSLGQKISGKHNADEEGHDVPDEAPDAKEKKEEEEEEAASSATQLGDVLELSEETTIEPITEVNGGTTEAIERNNEALVARNKDADYQEDESKKSDTEMLMTSEGHREADLTEELHEHHDQENMPSQMTTGSKISESEELETIEEGKEPVKSYTTNNSSMLKDGENQEDSAIVEESALQTRTIAVISEQDVSFSAFNRSIREVVEIEKSASAEEQNQQYKDSKYRIQSLLADESLESDGLVMNIEHNTSAGNEETSEELSKNPFDLTIEDATEERQRNDEVRQSDGRETKLEVQYTPTRKEDNENELTEPFVMTDQEPIEHEDEIKEKGIHETEENQNDANYLQNDEIKTLISTESTQNEEQKVTDLKSITETEPSIVAETVDECLPSKGQSSDNPTKIEKEFPEERIKGENLESDVPVEKHENEIAAADNETNEKSRHLSDSTKEDINEESLRNDAVAPTEVVSENQVTDNLIMTDQAPVEPEGVDNVKNIQENAEYQIDNDLQRDEMKTPTSLGSIQSEVQEAICSTNITETESSDIMETPYSQPEASTVAETADECDLVEEMGQSSQITTERNNEPSEKRMKENLESATLVEEHENKSATVNEEVNEILSKHPADAAKEDVTEEKLRCEVTPTDETETNLDVGRSINREVNENWVLEDLIMTSQVSMEPENEDKVLTAQEAAENTSDANELWHNEIKSVISSESVQIGNEQAPDSNHIHEIESSEKVETLYNNSETSTVAETFEEFGVPDETGQTPENNTKGEHQLRQRNKEENLESANLAANLEHETTDIYEETNGKLTKHLASSTEENMTTERSRSEVTPTEDIETNSKVVMEPENEEKSKGIQELSEEQKEATDLQQDEMKSVTSSESVQNESENATNFDKISETEILDKMGTPFNQSEALDGANTLEEAGLSDVLEGETVFESKSHTNFQDVGEIRQDGMDAKEIPQPTEVEEQLQETLTQLVPVEEKHIAPVEVIGETATDLKPLPNVREEQQFSELVLHEQKHKGSLQPKDIAEENTERFQSLEGKSTAYSVLEQIKDEKCLQEEVPRETDAQSLDFKTSKKLHLKEETTQETSTTDPKIIMQPRDFSSEIQCTDFSKARDSEKTTEADTSIHSSLEETKDDEKAQATITKEEQGHFGNAMLQSEENSLATLQTDSTGKHKGEDNWHVLSVEDALVTMDEAAIEEEQGPEEREKKGESMPTGETIIPSSDWHQVSAAEMSQMEGYSSKDEIAIDETEKVDHNEEDKIGRSEPVENEADVGDHTREDPGSIAPTITETSKDINVKATQKKSHNILSGVGSKVKHSISKVKKAITGKPSQPNNTSPKKATAKGE